MHAIIVPRAIYMESKLKARIDDGYTYPLGSSEFYAENDAQDEMSEAVTGVTAGELSGYRTYRFLEYLLQNSTGVEVYEAIDVTAYVPLLNLPADALQIIPWTGVTSGPTGSMPQGFWDWIGSIVTAITNALIKAGQLIYGGLIAIGNFFVALGEAIVEWGMKVIGTYQRALAVINEIVQRTLDVLGKMVDWVLTNAAALLTAVWQTILNGLTGYFNGILEALRELLLEINKWDDAHDPNGSPDHSVDGVVQKTITFILSFFNMKGITQSVVEVLLLIMRFVEPLLMIINPVTLIIYIAQVIMENVPALRGILEAVFGTVIEAWYEFVFGPGGLIYTTPIPDVPAEQLELDLLPFPSIRAIGNFITLGIVSPAVRAVLQPIGAVLDTILNLFPAPQDFVGWTAYFSGISLFFYKFGVAYKLGIDRIDEFGAGGLLLGGFALLMSTFGRFLAQDPNAKKTFTAAAVGFSLTGFGVFVGSILKGKARLTSITSLATFGTFALSLFAGSMVLSS